MSEFNKICITCFNSHVLVPTFENLLYLRLAEGFVGVFTRGVPFMPPVSGVAKWGLRVKPPPLGRRGKKLLMCSHAFFLLF